MWIFYPNSGVLVSLWTVQLWELIRLGSTPKRIPIYEENSSCHNHKNTKRDKQHFRFSFHKTFLRILSYLATKEITYMCSIQKNGYTRFTLSDESDREGKGRMNLIYLGSLRETTMDLCYRYINLKVYFFGFVDKIIWIHKDSISISWFWLDQQDSTSHFHSVRCFCLTAQNVCLPSGLCGSFLPKNVYLRPPKNVCLSLTVALNWHSISLPTTYME